MGKRKTNEYDPATEHDPLFDINPDDYAPATEEKQRRVKSVGFAVCPDCTNEKVGVIPSLSHLLYREHYRVTTLGRRLMCRASGSTLCVNPPPRPRDGEDDIPMCKHLPAGMQAAARDAAERARGTNHG